MVDSQHYDLTWGRHWKTSIAAEGIEVDNQVFLYEPAVKKGLTKKLHSAWKGPYVMVTRLSNVTYHIQAADSARKWKVVNFIRLKLCRVPQWETQQPEKDTSISPESSVAVRRPPPSAVSAWWDGSTVYGLFVIIFF